MFRKIASLPVRLVNKLLGKKPAPPPAPPRRPTPRPAPPREEGGGHDHGHSHGGGHDHGHSHGGEERPAPPAKDAGHDHGHSHGGEERTAAPAQDRGHDHGGHDHGHSHGGEERPAAPAPKGKKAAAAAAAPEVGLHIKVEESDTPNPNARKFTCSVTVIEKGSLSFNTAEDAANHPLGKHVWAAGGVKGIFAVKDFVTVTRDPATDWATLSPKVIRAIRTGLVERDAG